MLRTYGGRDDCTGYKKDRPHPSGTVSKPVGWGFCVRGYPVPYKMRRSRSGSAWDIRDLTGLQRRISMFRRESVYSRDQRNDMGSAKMRAGSIFEDLMSFIPLILMPVAKVIKPPQALKSQSISGLTRGIMSEARKNSAMQITNCGSAIKETR